MGHWNSFSYIRGPSTKWKQLGLMMVLLATAFVLLFVGNNISDDKRFYQLSNIQTPIRPMFLFTMH